MRRWLVVLFMFSWLLFSLLASGFVDSQDGFQYLAVTRRMYYDQTLALPQEEFPDDNIHLSLALGREGRSFSPTGLGYSLALIPAVAFEDVVTRLAGVEPLSAFPLQSDWPVLLGASLTNAVLGAGLVVVLYLLMRETGLPHRSAGWLSLVLVTASNLFAYTKHTFPHMMFVTFMTLSFYLVRRFARRRRRRYLLAAALSYGLVVISYNPTFLFPLPALAVYYLYLTRFRLGWDAAWWRRAVADLGVAAVGVAPWLLLYAWFNHARFGGVASSGYGGYNLDSLAKTFLPPARVYVEGFWGLLFSPGKSVFLFTPLLVLLIAFWHKVPAKVYAEAAALVMLVAVYLYMIGTLLGGSDFPVWHGDSSWGPRYILPILPLALVIIAHIFQAMSRRQRLGLFLPLVVLGIWIELAGMLLPYQLRFAGLQTDVFFNQRNFNVFEYGNEIPRYAPAFSMTKKLVTRLAQLPDQFQRGHYDFRLMDGFVRPFRIVNGTWREPLPRSLITFDNAQQPPRQVMLQLRNHQLVPTSSHSALVSISLNNQLLTQEKFDINEERQVSFNLPTELVQDKDNRLLLSYDLVGTSSAYLEKRQIMFLQAAAINGQRQSLDTIDYPYVSPVSRGLLGSDYVYYGTDQTDPWDIWHMHSGVYEETFDLWWLRPFHYWDFPRSFFVGLLALNVTGLMWAGFQWWRLVQGRSPRLPR